MFTSWRKSVNCSAFVSANGWATNWTFCRNNKCVFIIIAEPSSQAIFSVLIMYPAPQNYISEIIQMFHNKGKHEIRYQNARVTEHTFVVGHSVSNFIHSGAEKKNVFFKPKRLCSTWKIQFFSLKRFVHKGSLNKIFTCLFSLSLP